MVYRFFCKEYQQARTIQKELIQYVLQPEQPEYFQLNSQLEQAHPKESKKMTDNTQTDYPTWFKNPLNTRIRIGEHGHLLSSESYWQARTLSKDHVLVEMHFFMNPDLFTTNDLISHALSKLFSYDYSSMIEDIIKGVYGTRESFIKKQSDKRKVLLLTPLGVCKPSVFHNDNGDLTATWKAFVASWTICHGWTSSGTTSMTLCLTHTTITAQSG